MKNPPLRGILFSVNSPIVNYLWDFRTTHPHAIPRETTASRNLRRFSATLRMTHSFPAFHKSGGKLRRGLCLGQIKISSFAVLPPLKISRAISPRLSLKFATKDERNVVTNFSAKPSAFEKSVISSKPYDKTFQGIPLWISEFSKPPKTGRKWAPFKKAEAYTKKAVKRKCV